MEKSPTAGELAAALQGLRDLVEARDRLYGERHLAGEAAVRAALNAAEKAADRTAEALAEYKASVNEWQATFRDFRADRQGRTEGLGRLGAIVLGVSMILMTLASLSTLALTVLRRGH